MVGLVGVGGRVVVYRKFSGGQRPAETTEAMSEELSPRFFEPQCEVRVGPRHGLCGVEVLSPPRGVDTMM